MANRPLSYKGSITHSRGGWPTAFGLFRRAVSPSAAQGDDAQQIRGTDLVGAVRTLAAGESMLDPVAASRVMKPPGSSTTRKKLTSSVPAQPGSRWWVARIGRTLDTSWRRSGERGPLIRRPVPVA